MSPRGAGISIDPIRTVPTAGALQTGAWFLGSVVVAALSFLPALVVGDAVRPDYGWSANVVFYAAGSLTWLLLAFAGSVVLARLLSLAKVGDARTVAIVLAGMSTGTLVCLAYGGWAGAGYGSSDPDVLGIGILIPATTVFCALYAALSAVTVRPVSRLVLGSSALAYGAIVAIGLLNLRGLQDGLSLDGLLLAVAVVALGAVLAWAVLEDQARVREVTVRQGG